MQKHLIVTAILMIALASCQKEAANPTTALQTIQSTVNNTVAADETSPTFNVVDNGDGTYTATLQPDETNGQDVHVYMREGSPEIANQNFNGVPELDISAWTVNGAYAYLRVFLRFDDLAKISTTAHVLKATLYLYGLSSSIVSPQGNSTYPNSPYNFYGTNRSIMEAVAGPWDESTLTWNTQPKVKPEWGKVTIPASTSKWNYDVATDDVKAMVSRAVKYPDKNYGVRISLAVESIYRNLVFASSESTDPTKRPKLVVTYE